MFANGTLATAAGAEVDVIPVARGRSRKAARPSCYVVKDGKVERRSVVLGARNVERGVVVVREGLERGVPVITVKADGLKAGAGRGSPRRRPKRRAKASPCGSRASRSTTRCSRPW